MQRVFSRREMLGSLVTGALVSSLEVRPRAAGAGVVTAGARRARALQARLDAAHFEQQFPVPPHPDNGDEARFASRIGSFSKGLPHDGRGEVDPVAYASLLTAVGSGDPAGFERIILGEGRPLVNPQAGLAFELQGADSHALAMRPAPRFDSAQEAAEIAENYWMALTRDVPFARYGDHPTALQAAADLSRMSEFPGARQAGQVTPGTLFRGITPGDLTGPYISQFLWRRTPFGAEEVDRRMRTATPGIDYVTTYPEWLALQNGRRTTAEVVPEPVPRYIRSGRDIGEWVRHDVLFQAYFDALLVMLDQRVPFSSENPYLSSQTQEGFGTFGEPHVASALCAVATRALRDVWFQKWFVHRRLRPEAFAGCIHNHVTHAAAYPIHSDILTSAVLPEVFSRTGSYLLPMAYPEGAPQHPSYGAGHATVAGACVTVLKAFFDEGTVLEDPVEATPDGFELVPYVGPPLTVGGELNKLASNIALARNAAGVHWRSDATESLRLGEEIALRFLAEERFCMNEQFEPFTLTRFDGTRVTV